MKKIKWEKLSKEEKEKLSYAEEESLKVNYYIRLSLKISAIVILIIIALNCLTTVPTGYVGVKTRFGQVQDNTIQEGLNIKVPFIEKIVKIDCRTKKIETETSTASKDLQEVSLKVAINYNVNKETANTLYKEVGITYEDVIVNPSILESIKAVTAQYTAEELITKRAEVSNKMQDLLEEKIEDRGFNIVDFNIIDLDFSDAYNQAIEKKQVSEQEAKQAQYELEKAKVENEKKIENAKADAEVMRQQNQEITDKTLELKKLEVQQSLINKWNGQLPTTALGENIPILNLNK